MRPEDLVRLVQDVSADPVTRAGAAIALGEQGEQGRARLRVAAALPEVRALLRIAAEECEEEGLAEALERVVRR